MESFLGIGPLQGGDPERIGEYKLLDRLGVGGVGLFFLGRSPAGRLVAIKAIRQKLADDPEFRGRFAREVAAAHEVSGFFTAPVVDANFDGLVLWLAPALLQGATLAKAVRNHGPLPPATVQPIAAINGRTSLEAAVAAAERRDGDGVDLPFLD